MRVVRGDRRTWDRDVRLVSQGLHRVGHGSGFGRSHVLLRHRGRRPKATWKTFPFKFFALLDLAV